MKLSRFSAEISSVLIFSVICTSIVGCPGGSPVEDVARAIGIFETNIAGRVEFSDQEIEREITIEVTDFDTGEPVSGLNILYVSNGDILRVFIDDDSGMYYPQWARVDLSETKRFSETILIAVTVFTALAALAAPLILAIVEEATTFFPDEVGLDKVTKTGTLDDILREMEERSSRMYIGPKVLSKLSLESDPNRRYRVLFGEASIEELKQHLVGQHGIDDSQIYEYGYYIYTEDFVEAAGDIVTNIGSGASYFEHLKDKRVVHLIDIVEESSRNTWAMTFGTAEDIESATSVIETREGDFVLVGYTSSSESRDQDILLIKIDSRGNQLWTKTFGGDQFEFGSWVEETSDGGYIVAGASASYGGMYLIRTNAKGEEIWSRAYGGENIDQAAAVSEVSDGGFIVAGFTESFGEGGPDMFLVRTDENGKEMWARTFGGRYIDRAHGVAETKDGGFVLAGDTQSFGSGSNDVFVVRTDSSGHPLWTKTYGGTRIDTGNSLVITSDGGLAIVGYTTSFGPIGSGPADVSDVLLIRLDKDGNELFLRNLGSTESESGESIDLTKDGGFILAGTKWQGSGNTDMYLVKTDQNGEELWAKTFGGSGHDQARSVRQTSDGGYIVAGYSQSFRPGFKSDMYVIKTDANGDVDK